MPTHDTHFHVTFHSADRLQLVSTGEERVVFWQVDGTPAMDVAEQVLEMVFFAPPVAPAQLGAHVSHFTSSAFLPHSSQAVTGTVTGDLVLWEASPAAVAENRLCDKTAMKLVRVTRDEGTEAVGTPAVDSIAVADHLLAIGDTEGAVRMFDFSLKLVGWFEDIDAGSVSSISFVPTMEPLPPGHCPDFVVGTRQSLVLLMKGSSFHEVDRAARQGQVLLQGFAGQLVAALPTAAPGAPGSASTACSPADAHTFVAVTRQGQLSLWDHTTHSLQLVNVLNPSMVAPTTACMAADGRTFMVGTAQGRLATYQSGTLQPAEPLQQVTPDGAEIALLRASPDGKFLAAADSDNFVYLYRYMRRVVESEADQALPEWRLQDGEERAITDKWRWVFIGRGRAHSRRVVDLQWGSSLPHDPNWDEDAYTDAHVVSDTQVRCLPDSPAGSEDSPAAECPILVSVGEDQRLVVYDARASSIEAGLLIKGTRTRVEQSAQPTGLFWYPADLPMYTNGHPDRSGRVVVVLNNEFKAKFWSVNSPGIRRVALCPTFGGPLSQVILLPQVRNDEPPIFVYSTTDRVVGTMLPPMDGNPHATFGVVAHTAGAVISLNSFEGGASVLTCGSGDSTVLVWSVDRQAAVAGSREGGVGLAPFLQMLEGGATGEFYDDVRDYFAYAQIRSRGEDSTQPRRAGIFLPLSELPSLMRALGFYPTQAEITALLNEVRNQHEAGAEAGAAAGSAAHITDVDLATSIRLYVNHRPILGVGMATLADAMQQLASEGRPKSVGQDAPDAVGLASETALTWESFKRLLHNRGEPLAEAELVSALHSLLEGRAPPSMITTEVVADELLGFSAE